MPSIKERFPGSGYLTAQDVEKGDLTLQIAYVAWDEIVNGKPKDVVHFINDDRALILNNTNAHRIAKLYGDDGDGWRGHWITLYHDADVEYDGKKTSGIRVRQQAPTLPTEGNGPLPDLPPRPSRSEEMNDEIPF